jgi:signal peptidase I
MAIEFQQRSELACELAADVAQSFGEVRLKVTVTSMLPTLWPGDIITVQRRDMAALQLGNVVVYRREGMLVTHRVTHIRGDRLITRGDSIRYNDLPVNQSEIVGQAAFIDRNGRRMHLNQSCWQRIGSFLLRRSDFYRRIVVRVWAARCAARCYWRGSVD